MPVQVEHGDGLRWFVGKAMRFSVERRHPRPWTVSTLHPKSGSNLWRVPDTTDVRSRVAFGAVSFIHNSAIHTRAALNPKLES